MARGLGRVQRTLKALVAKALSQQQHSSEHLNLILSLLALALAFGSWAYTAMSPSPSIYVGSTLAAGFAGALVVLFWVITSWNRRVKACISFLIVGIVFWGAWWLMRRPSITAVASAEIVTRVYVRGDVPPVAAGEKATVWAKPSVQELFYEWTLRIASDMESQSETVVTVRDSAPLNDRVKVAPSVDAIVSPSVAGWLSGFQEPREPDFYTRTIKLPHLGGRGHDVLILLRRPMKLIGEISERFFYRSYEVNSPGSHLSVIPFDGEKEAKVLLRHFVALSTWPWIDGKWPLPIKADPDVPDRPVVGGGFEATSEARCSDQACSHLTVSNLEARRPLAN